MDACRFSDQELIPGDQAWYHWVRGQHVDNCGQEEIKTS